MNKAGWVFALVVCALCMGGAMAQAESPYFAFANGACTYGGPAARIAETLTLRVKGDVTEEAKSQLRLLVFGAQMNSYARVVSSDVVQFDLKRKDENRDTWSRLLGSPFNNELSHGKRGVVDMPVRVISGSSALPFHCEPQADATDPPTVDLEVYGPASMTFALLFVALVVVTTTILCWKTSMMRDNLVPQMRIQDRPFSLGRLQMAIWFCVILASFVFILTVTFDMSSINSQSFVLLGISGATALGAIAIDRSKDATNPGPNDPSVISADLAVMGLATKEDTERLFREARKNDAALANDKTFFPTAAVPGNAAPTLGDLLKAYESRVAPVRTAGWRDLVNDASGPTIHRWQILIWTLLLACIYIGRVYARLETPIFDTNLLTLIGISSGVYLGFKIPEKQS